jgi:hypothetical protein
MKISPTLVFLKDVHCDIERSDFLEADLNKSAKLILTMGGIVNPLVLRKTGVESYTVIDGFFEYWVAVRAREIDPVGGDAINAYIVLTSDEEKIVREQVDRFRKQGQNTDSKDDGVMKAIKGLSRKQAEMSNPQSLQISDDVLNQLEKRITEEVRKQVGTLREEIKKIKEINKKLDGVFTRIKGLSVPTSKVPRTRKSRAKMVRKISREELKTLPNQAEFLDAVKQLSDDALVSKLEKTLKHCKGNKKFIAQILTKRQVQSFNSIPSMMENIQGLGSVVVKDILTNWS